MDPSEVLQRIPAIAQAMLVGGRPDGAGPPDGPAGRPWTLTARDPGHPGSNSVQLQDYEQGRAMALELSELGLVVTLCDGDDRVRLRMWPPH